MPKRIWFKPKYHTALRLGLGYEVSKLDIMKAEAYCPECCGVQLVFDETNNEFACPKCDFTADIDCEDCLGDIEWHRIVPKRFTTRTHPLNGEYYVVEGSRLKAKPVEPQTQFKAEPVCMIDFKNKVFLYTNTKMFFAEWDYFTTYDSENGHTIFPEYDLGFRGATWDMLRKELLHLNKKATIETLFFINKLEPITREKPIPASYIAYKEAQIGALP